MHARSTEIANAHDPVGAGRRPEAMGDPRARDLKPSTAFIFVRDRY